jgi:hypothetical protein
MNEESKRREFSFVSLEKRPRMKDDDEKDWDRTLTDISRLLLFRRRDTGSPF